MAADTSVLDKEDVAAKDDVKDQIPCEIHNIITGAAECPRPARLWLIVHRPECSKKAICPECYARVRKALRGMSSFYCLTCHTHLGHDPRGVVWTEPM